MSALEAFIEFLKTLMHRWDALRILENDDNKSFHAEFNELISLTLESSLDFRNIHPNPEVEEYWNKIKIIISSLRLEESSNTAINNVLNTDKWNSQFGQWLLSGKLIGSSYNKLVTYDNKLLYESDEVINARLESLMKHLQRTSNEDTAQMILNVLETYRKFLLREVKFQCKVSCTTIEKLINYYMITVCHRKSNDHVSSMIKLFPNHRKISYVLNLLTNRDEADKSFTFAYKIQIAQEFIRELIYCEFQKSRSEQDINNYNLYVQQLIELALNYKTVEKNLEDILLCANDMNVISEYYYLAASQVRLQMPTKHNLAVKLISIGLSHDFSYLQEVKCSIDPSKETLEKEYRSAFRRIHLALVTLGCIIKDYALRRLCFQAASFCEYNTKCCVTILSFLPELETVDQGDNLDAVHLDVRYLLETFQYDIKNRTQLLECFEKFSSDSYDKLDHFNHTAKYETKLEPLQYPGVEKYMKRQAVEEQEHISQTSDLDKCLVDIDVFNDDLSVRLKKMRNNLAPIRKQKLPTEEQIDLKIKQILSKSPEFQISESGEIVCNPSEVDVLPPSQHWMNLKEMYSELNKDNLYFNFDTCSTVTDDNFNVNSVYSSGTVDVINLYCKGYSTYDIENIMLYTIMEKKFKFISEEFAYLNKNRNIESDEEQNQVHACFLYLANKPHPEFARLMRLSSTLKRYNNPIEYNVEHNTFDATPGKYRYRMKNKVYKERTDGPVLKFENGTGESLTVKNGLELGEGLQIPFPLSDIKRELPFNVSPVVAKQKREKIPPAINLAGVQTFNTSLDIQNCFKILQSEIASLLRKDVFIDISRISDISSPHLVQCTTDIKSTLSIKIQTIRNGNLSPREIDHEIKLPTSISGKLNIILEFRDEIKYDDLFENPFVVSTLHHRIVSNLVIDHVTHNAKCDIDCIINGDVSKIKLSFQGQKTYRPRKKVQKLDTNPTEQHVSVIQQPPKLDIQPPPQTNSKSIQSNIVMKVENSEIGSQNHQPQQVSYNFPNNNATPINPIAPPNQYNVLMNPQYSNAMPTMYEQGSYVHMNQDINPKPHVNSTVIQVPQPTFTNGVVPHHQPPPQYQLEQPMQAPEPYICGPTPVPPTNYVKPKVEILAIENISPIKKETNVTPQYASPKISFSNPCLVLKEEPKVDPNIAVMTIEKPTKQEIKEEEDNLVDFEDQIQTTMLASTQPKKLAETCSPLIPKSPPPLHYPVNKVESSSLYNNQIPQKQNSQPVAQSHSPQLQPTNRPNVIKSPTPTKQPETEPVEKIDLTQHVKAVKTSNPPNQLEVEPLKKGKIDLTQNILSIIEKTKQKVDAKLMEEKKNSPACVIDLTDDISESSSELLNKFQELKEKKAEILKDFVPDITFIECDTKPENSSDADDEDETFNKESVHRARHNLIKKSSAKKRVSKCKVYLADVMKEIDINFLKKNNRIRLQRMSTAPPEGLRPHKSHIKNTVAVEVPETNQDIQDEFVDTAYEASFTIVCHNSVSFISNDSRGDGIANVFDWYSKCKTNNSTNTVNFSHKLTNINAIKNLFEAVEPTNSKGDLNNVLTKNNNNKNILNMLELLKINIFQKPSYSDANHLNFTKNLKNRKKFVKWTPKECNFNVDNGKDQKSIFDHKKNHKSLLYQLSHAVMNSIPGLNSMEFFKMPSKSQRRLQIEVIHLKEIKSLASTETSDLNDGMSSEPGNNVHVNDGDAGESIQSTPTIHIQKIGQTSITHETESRTLQTSFGSIIKNTYPPATSRVVFNNSDILKIEKSIKISEESSIKKIPVATETSLKGAPNVKIIACSSQQQMSDSMKASNKNQTLINMLAQQVVVPPNSNRHYIITTKSTDNSPGTTCTLTSNNSLNASVRKTVSNASGQSQLVQILNSPPSNFAMKSLNVLSSANATNSKPGHLVAVSSSGNVDGLKTDLPDAIKQQGVVQFICKTDGKIIHLTPICNSNAETGVIKKITYKVDTSGAKGPTILHHANQQIILNNQLRKEENPNILTIIQKNSNDSDKKPKTNFAGISQNSNTVTSMGSTRSIYEETYAKFIQSPSVEITPTSCSSGVGLLTINNTPVTSGVSGASSSTFIQKIGKTVIQSTNQILPKFNQAFGKAIFSSTTLTDQTKVGVTRETTVVSRPVPVTSVKMTKSERNEITELQTDDKQFSTIQSALQGNSLLYARPIGNGKLIASNNNNVLLTALRGNNSQSNNVRIITSIPDSMSSTNRTIMTPVRISVPIQIPQLINSVRPQSPGNFRPQIVIAPTATTVTRPQSNLNNHNETGSKLQSLLMSSQQQATTTTINHQHDQNTDIEKNKVKVEYKQKKTVDNSTLEQLREFDMVLEQVLERSSTTPNSIASPPRDTSNQSSPRKQFSDGKGKVEIKSSSVSVTSNSPSDSPTSSKSLSSAKVTPKLQEDEHTAQRILDILANYKEQVRNSPDLNNKPAPRRRANPPTNPPAKRKKIAASSSTSNIKNSKQFGSSSDVMTDTMGSEEDSSCGVGSGVASTGSINNSPRGDIDDQTDVSMDNNFYMEDGKRETALSPQSSNSSITTSPAHNKCSVNRKLLVIESKSSPASDSISTKSLILNTSQSSASSASSITRSSIGESSEKLSPQSSTTAVLMPGNYILPMNVLKGRQHLAILSSNNGQKIIAVPASQLTSQANVKNSSGTSIILQRYVNQMSEVGGLGEKTLLLHSNEATGSTKTFQSHSYGSNDIETGSTKNHANNLKIIGEDVKNIKQENEIKNFSHRSSSSFVSDKTLITEIIQQQQQLSHHPQHNFMIKLNEPSNPKSSSSIMFMGDSGSSSSVNKVEDFSCKSIKNEKLDYDGCIKEEIIDLNNDHEILNSPMLNIKMEVDDNTNSNPDMNDVNNPQSQKLPRFPSILSSCLTKQSNSAVNVRNTKGFLIDPSSKILMYNDRKQSTSTGIDKEIFNQKSFSEECADLGVDEPIASDLFPEADLLFDSSSPKFDQINPNDGNMHGKRESENGEVLLQMNYNNNMSEPWLNFDTEDELVDDSHEDSSNDVKEPGSSSVRF